MTHPSVFPFSGKVAERHAPHDPGGGAVVHVLDVHVARRLPAHRAAVPAQLLGRRSAQSVPLRRQSRCKC